MHAEVGGTGYCLCEISEVFGADHEARSVVA